MRSPDCKNLVHFEVIEILLLPVHNVLRDKLQWHANLPAEKSFLLDQTAFAA